MRKILKYEKKIIAVLLIFMCVLSVFVGYFEVKNGEPYIPKKKTALFCFIFICWIPCPKTG